MPVLYWQKGKVLQNRLFPILPSVLLTKETEGGRSAEVTEQDSTTVPKFAVRSFSTAGILLGSAFPKPCMTAPSGAERRRAPLKKTYNTPHRTRVVKTRMTEDEYADFSRQLSPYGISQAEFIRRAIRGLPIHPIIKVSPVNDELLSSIGKLTAEYGKIGSNLNQIARSLNEYGAPYRELSTDVRAAIGELHDLKYELLRRVGDAIGDVQAYQL